MTLMEERGHSYQIGRSFCDRSTCSNSGKPTSMPSSKRRLARRSSAPVRVLPWSLTPPLLPMCLGTPRRRRSEETKRTMATLMRGNNHDFLLLLHSIYHDSSFIMSRNFFNFCRLSCPALCKHCLLGDWLCALTIVWFSCSSFVFMTLLFLVHIIFLLPSLSKAPITQQGIRGTFPGTNQL